MFECRCRGVVIWGLGFRERPDSLVRRSSGRRPAVAASSELFPTFELILTGLLLRHCLFLHCVWLPRHPEDEKASALQKQAAEREKKVRHADLGHGVLVRCDVIASGFTWKFRTRTRWSGNASSMNKSRKQIGFAEWIMNSCGPRIPSCLPTSTWRFKGVILDAWNIPHMSVSMAWGVP